MNTDNPLTSDRGLLTVGLVVLLALSALSGVPLSSSAPSADASARPAGDGPASVQEGENNTTNVTISVVRAMETARNETNGTPIGAELTRKGNVTDLERPSRVYEVDVLSTNGTRFLVDVNATDGSVVRVQTPDDETGFFEGLFGDEDGVQDRDVNVTEIRSGIEAVQLVHNETGDNRTVTQVELTSRNETLVYEVNVVTEEGARPSILVAAKPSEGGVLSNETGEEWNDEQRFS